MYKDEWNDKKQFDIQENEEIEESEEEEYEDDSDSVEEKPFNADRIRVENKPISVQQMYDMIKSQQLNLNPGFQRRKVWKEKKRKSLLIESLMLRIPLPVFYVYEDEDSVWHVVDGLQRMSTIYDYMNGKFELFGIQYLNNSKGRKFNNLDQKYKNRITQTTLMINVIDSMTPIQVKYDIFRRINTGGVPLTPQEIRNSTAKQKTREFLTKMIECEEFKIATNNMSDTRMQAQELVLRFIAFYLGYNKRYMNPEYKKGMESYLDNAFDRLNNSSIEEKKELEYKFRKAMMNSVILFGDNAFRRINNKRESKNKMPINKSLFTCTSVILADYNLETISDEKGIGIEEFKREIEGNIEFDESLSKGTSDARQIKKQFKFMELLIERVLKEYAKKSKN